MSNMMASRDSALKDAIVPFNSNSDRWNHEWRAHVV
jgi:hypothetical protein